ncbi:MAG: hypothetical protein WD080_01205 [Egibacteraceae bacterium]
MHRIRRVLAVPVLAVLVLAGCGEPLQPGQSDRSEPATPAAAADAIWFEVLGVSETATGDDGWHLAGDADSFSRLWDHHGFAGPPPQVDFGTRVVLVSVRAEDACPDDLVEMRLSGGVLEPTFLPPPGGCEEPLLTTAHVVAVHRGDLPEQLTAVLRQHEGHGGDVETQLSLPPYDGSPAPAPPAPPRQMSAAALDAVFDGHPLRRCDEVPDISSEEEPDPVSQAAATERELGAAQEALRPLHDDGTLSYSAAAEHLTVGVIDPTREDLDAIAALVDPAFTCVEPVLSGLP